MEMESFKIEVYTAENGSRPFQEWLDSLKDKTAKTKIYARLKRMEYGHFGDAKPIKGVKGLYELREHYGSGFRIFYSIEEGKLILLLAGAIKRDQTKIIAKSKEYLADYHRRVKHDKTK